jgi:nicotinate-nucleotide adenylyltransferase
MQIGLYFGSFNPIHIGHLIIAQHCLNQTDLQQIWFVVSPQNPFKQSSTLLNEYHRLHLVRLGIGENPGLKASDIEFHLPKPSYTSTTLVYLGEKFPHHQFSILLGSDGYSNIASWHNASFIQENYPLYVYERIGYPLTDKEPPKQGAFLKAPFLDISATHIRHLVADKMPITYLVPKEVEEEIHKNHYYRGH